MVKNIMGNGKMINVMEEVKIHIIIGIFYEKDEKFDTEWKNDQYGPKSINI